MSKWDAACVSLSVVYCQLSLAPSLSTPPSSISSRNWSGSGSCRSMKIWVRTVYVIVASINALLICSGLQPSIHIIHPHARPSPNCYSTHTHTQTRTQFRKTHWLADRERETKLRENNNTREGQDQGGQQAESESTSLFVFGLSYLTNTRVLIGYRYTSAHLHRANCQLKHQTEISQPGQKEEF